MIEHTRELAVVFSFTEKVGACSTADEGKL